LITAEGDGAAFFEKTKITYGILNGQWVRLNGAERFYLKLLDLETKGFKTLDNYQNFAKAFKGTSAPSWPVKKPTPPASEAPSNSVRAKWPREKCSLTSRSMYRTTIPIRTSETSWSDSPATWLINWKHFVPKKPVRSVRPGEEPSAGLRLLASMLRSQKGDFNRGITENRATTRARLQAEPDSARMERTG
jgi:hypothetical protein